MANCPVPKVQFTLNYKLLCVLTFSHFFMINYPYRSEKPPPIHVTALYASDKAFGPNFPSVAKTSIATITPLCHGNKSLSNTDSVLTCKGVSF